MKIAVIGLGYVGAITAACLARDGHDVVGIDLDETKLSLLKSGRSPVVEAGIDDITRDAVQSGRLRVSSVLDEGLAQSDLIFLCVGTPSDRNGSQDLTAVRRVSEQIGRILRGAQGFPVVVLRSTVYPGTTEDLVVPLLEEHSGRRAGVDFGLCFQPEFLREGSSVKDFYAPPFTIVGTDSNRSAARVQELFAKFPGEFISTSYRSAEMLKLTCNVFHALKVTFANEVGRLGQSLSVDSREVMDLVCRDKNLNISPAYLRPGFAFGGSCLPKDLRAMLYLAKTRDVELPLVSGIARSNPVHIQHAADLVMSAGSRKVGLIGLSFKAGTDDLRESPLVGLAETLIGKGYDLCIYDPAVNLARLIGANKRFIEQMIPHIESMLMDDLPSVLDRAEVLVVGHKYDRLVELAATRRFLHIVDLVGLDDLRRGAHGYTGVSW